jgi:hypothetical protein
VDVDRATRLARVTERMGAELTLSRVTRESRLRRVQEAWLHDLSRRALAAACREMRLERSRIDGAAAAQNLTESASPAAAGPAEPPSGPRSPGAGASDGMPPRGPTT